MAIQMVIEPDLEAKRQLVTRHSVREAQKTYHILLAEANRVSQRLTVALLQKKGYAVTVAENGKQVLQILAMERFDLILMDGQMPEMDGLETTCRIREQEKETGAHIPIIAMTAHALNSDRERFLEAGMDGYLTKPIRPEELFATIEAVGRTR